MTSKNKTFKTVIKNDDYMIRDHQVHGVRIMPGVCLLDSIYRSAQACGFALADIELRNILFTEPIATTELFGRRLELVIKKVKKHWCVSVHSQAIGDNSDQSWNQNAQCDLYVSKAISLKSVSIDSLKKNADQTFDMDDIYALARQLDIQHIDFMKALGTVYRGKDYALMELELGDLAARHLEKFYMHPALLDAATFASVAIFGFDEDVGKVPSIPFSIERFRAFSPFDVPCYVLIKVQDVKQPSRDISYCDFHVFNKNGDCIATFKRMSSKRIRSKELITKLTGVVENGTKNRNLPDSKNTDDRQHSEIIIQHASLKNADGNQFHRNAIIRKILPLFVESSNKSIEEISETIPFYDMGFDSSMLLRIVKHLEEMVGTELYPTLLFEHSTLTELADYLADQHDEKFSIENLPLPNLSQNQQDGSDNETNKLARTSSELEDQNNVPFSEEQEIIYQKPVVRKQNEQIDQQDIAIIGVAGGYPNSKNLSQFWDNISNGRNCIREITRDHWDPSSYFEPTANGSNKIYSKWGGLLPDFDTFDPKFFSISPLEAVRLDPQLRLMLQTAWHTVEDAGYTPSCLSSDFVGVYVGVMNVDYSWMAAEILAKSGMYTSQGSYGYDIANRVSYSLNFQGPSITIETACSSSLTAIHMAKQALLSGECNVAIAGGVNLSLHASKYLMLSNMKILAADGKEKTFDEKADGYVPGEGVGCVMLKPLVKAIDAADQIYGIIKGSTINHAGTGAGRNIPSLKSIVSVAERCLEHCNISPEQISYIESHGTGTAIGDPIEIQALTNVFRKYTDRKQFCALGSKANMGHLESASGICSLTKVLLSMKYAQIPQCSNVQTVNPAIQITQTPFFIPEMSSHWHSDNIRLAAINSFGMGGSNCFMIISEYQAENNRHQKSETTPAACIFSAKTADQLDELVVQFLDYLATDAKKALSNQDTFIDIAYTLQIGREEMNERLGIVAPTKRELIEKLTTYKMQGGQQKHVFRGSVKKNGEHPNHNDSLEDKKISKINAIKDLRIEECARFWSQGGNVDWQSLHDDQDVRKISLPLYPFAKSRYSISMDTGISNNDLRPVSPPAYNPAADSVAKPSQMTEANNEIDGSQLHFYNVVHIQKKITEEDSQLTSAEIKTLLIFDNKTSRGNCVQKLINDSQDHNPNQFYVRPGKKFKSINRTTLEIRPNNYEDYCRLLDHLSDIKSDPTHILHLWNMDESPIRNDIVNLQFSSIESQLQIGLYSIFHLTKALIDRKPTRRIKIGYFYRTNGLMQPHHSAIAAFAASAMIENPNIAFTHVGLDTVGKSLTSIGEIIFRELTLSLSHLSEVIYHSNDRWGRKFQSTPVGDKTDIDTSPLKHDGVYWLTGGTGGVGLIMARYLTCTVGAHVIIGGRKTPSDKIRTELDEIKAAGGDIRFIEVDVTKRQSVNNALKQIKTTFDEVNGVIHCAGSIEDSFILKKNDASFSRVLGPKILGAIHLDAVTKNEPLDFFVMFSSISSIMGNAGQSDYAAGNRFMDDFAELRENLRTRKKRKGKTLSINWPLWEHGGMQVSQETLQLIEKSTGMRPLSDEMGVAALETGLKLDVSQLIVWHGQEEKITKLLEIEDVDRDQCGHSINGAEEVTDESLVNFLHKKIIISISNLLKFQESDIDIDEDLNDYGFDSITLTEFSSQLNETYQLEINPTVYFEHSTIRRFTNYLIDNHRDALMKAIAPEARLDQTGNAPANPKADLTPNRPLETHLSSMPNTTETAEATKDSIAVIGIACNFPQSPTPSIFWDNLSKGKLLISEIPRDRFDWRDYQCADQNGDNTINTKWGGFINDADKFDALFFNISPREAALMDPQQRVFLESAWACIEDSGYRPSSLSGSLTGVFVGVSTNDYQEFVRDTIIEPHSSTGIAHSVLANRISYILDLHGPSEAIDTACSSSLVAIHRAVIALHNGDCHMAIAGGVNLMFSPETFIGFSKAGMLAEDGKCKTFDRDANGYVRGEGTGSIFMKPLERAIADNDHIYGVIKGSAVNHGGHASSLTAPNPVAQADVLVTAYQRAGIHPDTVSFIEAHGTGTALGDPVEINGLKKAFAQLTERDGQHFEKISYCGLGSVKSNIGHLEAAAGIAGVIKTLLAFKHKMLAPTINFKHLNPYIEIEKSPFYIVDKLKPWEPSYDQEMNQLPRRAGVSSFGFGGANAHVVLEEYVKKDSGVSVQVSEIGKGEESPESGNRIHLSDRSDQTDQTYLIVLSARNEECLREYAKELLKYVSRHLTPDTLALTDLAYTLQVGREAMEERIAFIVHDEPELYQKLEFYISGQLENNGIFKSSTTVDIKLSHPRNENDSNTQSHVLDPEKLDLAKLASLWVNGKDIDWDKLVYSKELKRISLPTYPFSRERHWVSETEPGRRAKHKNDFRSPTGVIHPLIDFGQSTNGHTVFNKRFSGQEFYIQQHQVSGKMVLPGAIYLEMAHAAADSLNVNENFNGIRNVLWAQPITFNESEEEVTVHLYTDEENLDFEICTGSGNETSIHAQGKLCCLEKDQSLESNDLIDINSIKEQCSMEKNKQEVYDEFIKIGFEYGTELQVIQTFFVNDEISLAHLVLPDQLRDDFSDFTLHPAIIDGALQAVVGAFQSKNSIENTLFLPVGLGTVKIINHISDECYAYVMSADTMPENELEQSSGKMRKFNIIIIDMLGKPLIFIKDFSLKPFKNFETDSVIQNIRKDRPTINSTVKTTAQPKLKSTSLLQTTQTFLTEMVAEKIRMSAAKIKAKEPLEKYGIDSMIITELNGELEKSFGELSKTLLFEYQTIDELAHYFLKNHEEKLKKLFNLGDDEAEQQPPMGIEVTNNENTQTVKRVENSKKGVRQSEDSALAGFVNQLSEMEIDELIQELQIEER